MISIELPGMLYTFHVRFLYAVLVVEMDKKSYTTSNIPIRQFIILSAFIQVCSSQLKVEKSWFFTTFLHPYVSQVLLGLLLPSKTY